MCYMLEQRKLTTLQIFLLFLVKFSSDMELWPMARVVTFSSLYFIGYPA